MEEEIENKICPFCRNVAMNKEDKMSTPGLQDVYRCPNCFYVAGFMYKANYGPQLEEDED
jgi:hypothetical protein